VQKRREHEKKGGLVVSKLGWGRCLCSRQQAAFGNFSRLDIGGQLPFSGFLTIVIGLLHRSRFSWCWMKGSCRQHNGSCFGEVPNTLHLSSRRLPRMSIPPVDLIYQWDASSNSHGPYSNFFFFFLNQFIFRHTVPRTSPVVAMSHYI
jgi:hypothetical protein